jgi:hypothetical protein
MPTPPIDIDTLGFETIDALMTSVLDIEGIASLLGYTVGTVQLWNSKSRGILPPPPWNRGGVPLWWKPAIILWARKTGRWKRKRVNRWDVPKPEESPTGAAA